MNGYNVFEWKRKYTELASSFVRYADHTVDCRYTNSPEHHHDTPVDDRIVCDAVPCTCGLVSVLEEVNPPITYIVPCPLKQPGLVIVPTAFGPLAVHPKDVTVHLDPDLNPDTHRVPKTD